MRRLFFGSSKTAKISKTITCLLTAGLIAALDLCVAFADTVPYDTYNYDYREDIVMTPAAYMAERSVSGASLSFNGEPIGTFKLPEDLCVSDDEKVYIADTGNDRIVVLNLAMDTVLEIITTYNMDGNDVALKQPTGIFISSKNQLYIADSGNKRVVALDTYEEGRTFLKKIENPKSDLFAEDFEFVPKKIAVDYADRIYVVAKGKTEGIMAFSENCEFNSFFGTINVELNAWQKFWRRTQSLEARAKDQLYIATEYSGIDIDDKGFIYATYIDSKTNKSVQRINPKGGDVIVAGENGNINGDIGNNTQITPTGADDKRGKSKFEDIVYRDKGIYSVLDTTRGRIFTYDSEGNLLYIFGGLGTQAGTLALPKGIEAIGDRILVLDAGREEIMIYKETEYGRLINDAVGLRYDGDEKLAVAKWEEVLRLDENFEQAAIGIGKAYLTSGENEKAMHYLKLGNSRKFYSIAFKRFRNQFLRDNLGAIMTGAVILIAVYIVVYQILKRKNIIKKKEEVW